MATAAELFGDLQERLRSEPERTRGVTATYQFVLTGEGGGEWLLEAADGTATVREGRVESPQVTVTMTADDYIGMASGQLSGQDLFFAGRMRVVGDQFLAMKLGEMTR
ncbi:MAG: SCP2 sterol-binding domain-containing protein [Candidatus Dormibacteraeota bacterium]|nr:SCP2 sterol-binding domain-containing protein [Candidatus Dormibacteraeota bacterium]MBV9525187.1 SCP2 sterol-binding domain-containing protein [Candidatus Dormibacteraeota bacterium]